MYFLEKHLITFLVVFFILLVGDSIYSFFISTKEGMENNNKKDGGNKKDGEKVTGYKDYNTNNPENALILAQQNAGNIESLRQKIKDQEGIGLRLDNLEATVENQQTEINGLVEQQTQYAQDISASEPVDITGTTMDDELV